MMNSLTDIVIVGAGGFAREVVGLIADINRVSPAYNVIGFVDDRPELEGHTLAGIPVLGSTARLLADRVAPCFALAVGSPAAKLRIGLGLTAAGLSAPTLVHPSVLMQRTVEYGSGCIVCAGTILTCDISVGRFVTINLGCTIGHDSTIGDYATIAPGANISGNTRIGEGSDVGTAVATVQGRTIGDWSIVGAGAVVSADIPANCTAVGVPAKPIKQRDAGWHIHRG